MGALRYRRHFALLAGAAALLVLIIRLPTPFPVDRGAFALGVTGALHALAVVLALAARPPWLARIGFVAGAAVLSIATLFAGLRLTEVLGIRGFSAIFAAVEIGSGLGAAAYWLLLRTCWARSLPVWSLLLTVVACVLSTLVASLALGVLPYGRGALMPILWWVAFSGSLAITDRARPQ